MQSAEVSQYEMKQFEMARIPPLPNASTAKEWRTQVGSLRQHILDDIVYHGWPREWVESPPHFEQAGVIETRYGYRIRKLRYEIVPGFQSTALLYEPDKISGKVPAILNVLGHEPAGNCRGI